MPQARVAEVAGAEAGAPQALQEIAGFPARVRALLRPLRGLTRTYSCTACAAVSPRGKNSARVSVSWAAAHSSRRTRVPLVQIRFDATSCRACPLRPQCTAAGNGKWGRALTLCEPAQRAALQ